VTETEADSLEAEATQRRLPDKPCLERLWWLREERLFNQRRQEGMMEVEGSLRLSAEAIAVALAPASEKRKSLFWLTTGLAINCPASYSLSFPVQNQPSYAAYLPVSGLQLGTVLAAGLTCLQLPVTSYYSLCDPCLHCAEKPGNSIWRHSRVGLSHGRWRNMCRG